MLIIGASICTEIPDNFVSPDATSDGVLPKRWTISEGIRYLLKGSFPPFRQEPYNEVIATKVCKALGVPCVEYNLVLKDNPKGPKSPYSICPCFVTSDTEFVTAFQVLEAYKEHEPQRKSTRTSVDFGYLIRACKFFKIPQGSPSQLKSA